MARVGIMGASGYMGGEALRVLLEHPEVDVAWATSRSPGPAEDFHPNLYGAGVELIHPDDATPCDVVFLALPTESSIAEAERFLSAGAKVIDLGAAFRLADRAVWESVYGQTHPSWSLAEEAVYGVPELHEKAIRAARLIANPGCFSSAAILALAPLIQAGWIEPHVVIDGLSGTAGAGAELTRATHHSEIGNNLIPYNVVGPRHTYEMEQELTRLAGQSVSVHFTPTYVPIVRGILVLCHAVPTRDVSRESVLELHRDFYRDAPFVAAYDRPAEPGSSWQYRPYPQVSAVAGTNYCTIGVDVDTARRHVLVLSALDNVGKGGALVGIENMNLMLGLPRTCGLTRRGLHPA